MGSITCWPRFFVTFFVPFLLWDFPVARAEDLRPAVLLAVWVVAWCLAVVCAFDEDELGVGADLAGAVVDVADDGCAMATQARQIRLESPACRQRRIGLPERIVKIVGLLTPAPEGALYHSASGMPKGIP